MRRSGGFKIRLLAYCNSNCDTRPTPFNDDCEAATTLTPFTTVIGTTNYALYQPNPNFALACENNASVLDVWYKYHSDTTPLRASRAKLLLRSFSMDTLYYSVYKGNCNTFQLLVDCKSIPSYGIASDSFPILESNQDYYVRFWTHAPFYAANFTVQLQETQFFNNLPIANAVTTNTCQPFAQVDVTAANYRSWLGLMDNGQLVAEINPYGNLLGNVSGGYFINSSGTIRRASGTPYLDRNVGIRVGTQPTTDVGIRLYFTEQERARYFAAVGANPIAVTHYAGALCMANTQSGSGDVLPAVIRNAPNGNYYVEFNTRRFSGFFIGPNRSLVFTQDLEKNSHLLTIEYLYPVPVSDDLKVAFTAAELAQQGQLRITDVLGKTVLETPLLILSGLNTVNLNLATLTNGIYFLTISDGVHQTTQKIVKQ
jgi:hypothetical protein